MSLGKLKHLTDEGILNVIENEYTPWVNSNGSICLCLDSCDLNKATKRNPYYVRTFGDVITQVSDATHFSLLDARSGFWQVELDDGSSRLCMFNTPWGKCWWSWLPFRLIVSGDVFQEKMDLVFGELEGVTGIADDTFVSLSEAYHYQHIINVLDKYTY